MRRYGRCLVTPASTPKRVWQRPTNYLIGLPYHPRCRHPRCGTAAFSEYAVEPTCIQPNGDTIWTPYCFDHRPIISSIRAGGGK